MVGLGGQGYGRTDGGGVLSRVGTRAVQSEPISCRRRRSRRRTPATSACSCASFGTLDEILLRLRGGLSYALQTEAICELIAAPDSAPPRRRQRRGCGGRLGGGRRDGLGLVVLAGEQPEDGDGGENTVRCAWGVSESAEGDASRPLTDGVVDDVSAKDEPFFGGRAISERSLLCGPVSRPGCLCRKGRAIPPDAAASAIGLPVGRDRRKRCGTTIYGCARRRLQERVRRARHGGGAAARHALDIANVESARDDSRSSGCCR